MGKGRAGDAGFQQLSNKEREDGNEGKKRNREGEGRSEFSSFRQQQAVMFAPLSVELQSYISKEHKIISRLSSENSKNLNGVLHPLHCFSLQSSATSGSRLPGERWEVPDAL